MLKKIITSPQDEAHIQRLPHHESEEIDSTDYSNTLVNKPWGYEYMAFKNNDVCIWILFIKEGYQTSMHCHPNKKTALIVLSGTALFENLNSRTIIDAGQGVFIEKKVFHSTKAISSPGIIVMETETPVNKGDLLRLNDAYGRAGKGYEGTEYMVPRESQTHYSFHDEKNDAYHNLEKMFGQCSLTIRKYQEPELLKQHIHSSSADIICSLKGKIFNHKGECIVDIGEMSSVAELQQYETFLLDPNETEFLFIKRYS